jgi:pimeloyl-ACP methyl ester carboxylesterase
MSTASPVSPSLRTRPTDPARAGDGGRARLPDETGVVRSVDGVAIAYEVFGQGDPTIVLLPSAPIIHSRQWKGQVPYLSRRWRVITYDGRGNGRSDRPEDPEAYLPERVEADLEAVLGATATREAVLVGLCGDGVWTAVRFAAARPERIRGIVAFAVGVPLLSPPHPWRLQYSFTDPLPTDEGWAKVNEHYWRRDYRGFAEFFFGEMLPERYSTKQLEDVVGWVMDGSMEAMRADMHAPVQRTLEDVVTVCRSVRAPMLLVHGTEDRCQPLTRAQTLSELVGAPLVILEGAGHLIPGRQPVKANLLIADFVRRLSGSSS